MKANFPDQLFQLLPAVHQLRDAHQQNALQNLLRVIGEQVQHVHGDIERLYENWFIETCDDWAVPYLADLVGFRRVDDAGELGDALPEGDAAVNRFAFPRREVANTVRLRRRKGTLSVLEDLASNVAGWQGRAVDFGRLVVSTFDHRFPEIGYGRLVDFSNSELVERIDTPFDQVAHTVDFRESSSMDAKGWQHPGRVGLFVWRRQVMSVHRGELQCVALRNHAGLYYSVHPMGRICQLYVKQTSEPDEYHLAAEQHLPVPLTRALLLDVDQRCSQLFYGAEKSLFLEERCLSGDQIVHKAVEDERIIVVDLRPLDQGEEAQKAVCRSVLQALKLNCQRAQVKTLWGVLLEQLTNKNLILFDPQTGRVVASKELASRLRVSWCDARPALYGGGEYDRGAGTSPRENPTTIRVYNPPPNAVTLQELLQSDFTPARCPDAMTPMLDDAGVTLLQDCVIEFGASGTWEIDLQQGLTIPAGVTLELRARNRTRPVLRLRGAERECQSDQVLFRLQPGAELRFNGLQITGDSMRFLRGGEHWDMNCPHTHLESIAPASVQISHSSWMPMAGACHCEGDVEPALTLEGEGIDLRVTHSVLGGLRTKTVGCNPGCPIRVPVVTIVDSVLDCRSKALCSERDEEAIAELFLRRSTVLGDVACLRMEADDSILSGVVTVKDRQHGFMRYCYLGGATGTDSCRTPRRFRCQPDLAERTASSTTEVEFYSTEFGNAGYCQLRSEDHTLAYPISRGAESESEMGVFHNEYFSHREVRLRQQLEEFTPIDMQSTLILAEELEGIAGHKQFERHP